MTARLHPTSSSVPNPRDDQSPSLLGVDLDSPSPARIYDYWLGGNHNFRADRDAGERVAAELPDIVPIVRETRSFLRRVVRYLVKERGISQFLDLGSGIPTLGNVHEVAQQYDPDARVVYVDIDPVAIAHAQFILGDNPNVSAIRADIHQVDTVLGHPAVANLLDLSKPVAVLMISVLHFLTDEQEPAAVIRGFSRRVVPGSYLVMSHASVDTDQIGAAIDDYRESTRSRLVLRGRDQLLALLRGLEVEEPGLVPVSEWRPDTTPCLRSPALGALARVPDLADSISSTARGPLD
jgi:SAM-dependent methyltransferase